MNRSLHVNFVDFSALLYDKVRDPASDFVYSLKPGRLFCQAYVMPRFPRGLPRIRRSRPCGSGGDFLQAAQLSYFSLAAANRYVP